MLETINTQKNRSENIKEILFGRSDDTLFYKIVVPFVFNEFGLFEVRKDIKIPIKEFDGTIMSFNDGKLGYFKIQKNPLNNSEFKSIIKVCEYLNKKYGCPIDSYVLCHPEIKLRKYNNNTNNEITLKVKSLRNYDGDAVVEILENKRKNKEKFTFHDHVCHILLPYMGYENKKEFMPKYQHYILETMIDNVEKQGIEVVRFE